MAEAVVVLNGNDTERYERLQRALEVQNRLGVDLIVSGGFSDSDFELINAEFSESCGGVILGERHSRDTIGNALWSTTDYIAIRDYVHIRLVTSDYHIDRARWLFATVNNDRLSIETDAVPTFNTADQDLRLRKKERLLTAAAGLVLWNCDFRTHKGYEKAKSRVKTVFRSRYSPNT